MMGHTLMNQVYPASPGHGQQLSSRSEGLALGKVEQSCALSIMNDLDRGSGFRV